VGLLDSQAKKGTAVSQDDPAMMDFQEFQVRKETGVCLVYRAWRETLDRVDNLEYRDYQEWKVTVGIQVLLVSLEHQECRDKRVFKDRQDLKISCGQDQKDRRVIAEHRASVAIREPLVWMVCQACQGARENQAHLGVMVSQELLVTQGWKATAASLEA
jgi:hypothetical protein